MRHRARISSKRFSDEEFDKGWVPQFGKLVAMHMLPDDAGSFGFGNKMISISYLSMLVYDFLRL